VTGKRRRVGRPPLDPDDPSVPMMLRLPSKQYDATYKNARAARESVSDYVRRLLRAANGSPSSHRIP